MNASKSANAGRIMPILDTGGNIKLKERNPENFVFTILQPTSPDMEKADIERLESSWKDRLHTKQFGLNDN